MEDIEQRPNKIELLEARRRIALESYYKITEELEKLNVQEEE